MLDNAQQQASRNGDVMLMTEFGSTSDLKRQAHLVAEADRRQIGWMEWSYWNPENRANWMLVRDLKKAPTGANINLAKLRLLGPAVSAAGLRYAVGVAGRLDYGPVRVAVHAAQGGRSTTFPRGSLTRIAVPRLWHPKGYQVRVYGARVVARHGAVLEVASTTRTGPVKVVLTRR